MTIELLAGEQRELNVAMQPLNGNGQGIPVMLPYIYMVDFRTEVDKAWFALFCPVKNEGTQAITRKITFHYMLEGGGEYYERDKEEVITIPPGEVAAARTSLKWFRDTRSEMWAVGDWGETSPVLHCTFGYRYTVPNAGQVVCTHAGPDYATLRFSQYSMCNTWEFYCKTPPTGTREQLLSWKVNVQNDPRSRYWHCIHTAIRGLLPGRSYEAYGAGGPSWQEDWTQFNTP